MPPEEEIMPKKFQIYNLAKWLREHGIEPDTVDLEAIVNSTLHYYENQRLVAEALGMEITPAGKLRGKDVRLMKKIFEEQQAEKLGVRCPDTFEEPIAATVVITAPDGTREIVDPTEYGYHLYWCPEKKYYYVLTKDKLRLIDIITVTRKVQELRYPRPPRPPAPPGLPGAPPAVPSYFEGMKRLQEIVELSKEIEQRDPEHFAREIKAGKTLRAIVEEYYKVE